MGPGGDRGGVAGDVAGDVVAQLEQLYAQLPVLHCLGRCGHFCGRHVDASAAERARIAARGVDLDSPTVDGACPALRRVLGGTGHCGVHQVRPMVWRLWGVAEAMPCEHGCRPAGGHVDDAQTLRWMLTSLEIGRHRDAGLRAILEHCLHDPTNAALLGQLLRGDRSGAAALRARFIVPMSGSDAPGAT